MHGFYILTNSKVTRISDYFYNTIFPLVGYMGYKFGVIGILCKQAKQQNRVIKIRVILAIGFWNEASQEPHKNCNSV